MQRPVTALLGPTNTGKTHLAIERMRDARQRHDGLPAAPARPRELRPRRGPEGARGRRADHRRGAHRPPARPLLDLHGRGDAARLAGGLPGHRRGAALGGPRARARLHRSRAERARRARDVADRGRDHPADPARAAAGGRVPDARAPLDAVATRSPSASPSCRRARRWSCSRCASCTRWRRACAASAAARRSSSVRCRRARAMRRSACTRPARSTTWWRRTPSAWG